MTTRKLTAAQIKQAAAEYVGVWDSREPIEATARLGLSPVDAERLTDAYGEVDGRRIGRAVVREAKARVSAWSAARALRAIPSETRSETSRTNGRRGGRPRVALYRVTTGTGTYQDVCTLVEARRMARSYVADGWSAAIRRLADDAPISIR